MSIGISRSNGNSIYTGPPYVKRARKHGLVRRAPPLNHATPTPTPT